MQSAPTLATEAATDTVSTETLMEIDDDSAILVPEVIQIDWIG